MGPCYKCEKRSIACHANCEEYIKWKKAHDEIMERKHFIERNTYYSGKKNRRRKR